MKSVTMTLLLASLTSLTLSSCQEKDEVAQQPPRAVLSTVVKMEALQGTSFAGTVQPKVQTVFGPRVAGLLVARDVDIGDVVTRGQLLAALDPTSLTLVVNSARADLVSAEATLANARSVEQRANALLKGGTETRAAVENAERSSASAQASVVQARSVLSKAEEQLSYTQITAAYDGIVTEKGAEVGQVVTAGASVVTVAKPDERDAVVDISDNNRAITEGTLFSVSLQVNPALSVNGRVREIAPAADEATRTRRVKIALENPPQSFRLGTTITASLKEAVAARIILPASAILSRDGKTFVWVVDEGKAVVNMREIQTGPDIDGRIVALSGVGEGTRVVTAGVNSLTEGQKIRIEGRERP